MYFISVENFSGQFDVADGFTSKAVYLIEGLLRGVGFETDLRNGNRGVGAQARIPRYIG